VVDLCQEAGLVWGQERYFGATKVETNAGIPSLIPRFYDDAKTLYRVIEGVSVVSIQTITAAATRCMIMRSTVCATVAPGTVGM
jgi:hypothetical protein